MGYPNPIKASISQIASNAVTVSCPFSIMNRLNVGARMSLLQFDDNVVVFSPIPLGDHVNEALELLTGKKASEVNVSHLFVVNHEHNLAAKPFKEAYPDIKIIAGYNVKLDDCQVDCVLTKEMGNKLLTGEDLNKAFGFTESWWDKLNVMLLKGHASKDVLLYSKESKTLFEGDVIFNIGGTEDGKFEQYSPATGYPEKFYPFTGWSYLLKYVHPNSAIGRWLHKKINRSTTPEALEGLKMVNSLDFETIVPCHGNIITKDAKKIFEDAFNGILS